MENKPMTHSERSAKGHFVPGNQLWKHRHRHGRKRRFATPEALWTAACQYFEWSTDSPLMEVRYVGANTVGVEIPRMRPFTIMGLCLYLGVHSGYFWEMKKKGSEEFQYMAGCIEDVVYEQKFTGAATGLLNEGIIIRELGLRNKKQIAVPKTFVVTYV